jgi:hypothetical protein
MAITNVILKETAILQIIEASTGTRILDHELIANGQRKASGAIGSFGRSFRLASLHCPPLTAYAYSITLPHQALR